MTKPKKETIAEVKSGTLVTPIKTDAVVDMNSIVAFFISKYENTLFDSKKELSAKINEINTYLAGAFLDKVKKDIKIEQFEVKVPALDLDTTAEVSVQENWMLNQKKATVSIRNNSGSNLHLMYNKNVVVSDEIFNDFVENTNKLQELRNSLKDILDKLSNVSRKEREIRGALAEKTLRESGAGDLFNDPALMKCIDLPALTMEPKKKK